MTFDINVQCDKIVGNLVFNWILIFMVPLYFLNLKLVHSKTVFFNLGNFQLLELKSTHFTAAKIEKYWSKDQLLGEESYCLLVRSISDWPLGDTKYRARIRALASSSRALLTLYIPTPYKT